MPLKTLTLLGACLLGMGLSAAGCSPTALYESDEVFFAAGGGGPARRPSGATGSSGGGGVVVHAPPLPAADDPAVVARFLVRADGPLALGQSFTPGALRPADRVMLRLGEQSLPADLVVLATHPDGSVRHAVLSTTLPGGMMRRGTPALLVRLP